VVCLDDNTGCVERPATEADAAEDAASVADHHDFSQEVLDVVEDIGSF
jgi:hypothetical protein